MRLSGHGIVARVLSLHAITHERYVEGIRHDAIMQALGRRGVQVPRPGQLRRAMSDALAGDVPACIDVPTNDATPLVRVI